MIQTWDHKMEQIPRSKVLTTHPNSWRFLDNVMEVVSIFSYVYARSFIVGIDNV